MTTKTNETESSEFRTPQTQRTFKWACWWSDAPEEGCHFTEGPTTPEEAMKKATADAGLDPQEEAYDRARELMPIESGDIHEWIEAAQCYVQFKAAETRRSGLGTGIKSAMGLLAARAQSVANDAAGDVVRKTADQRKRDHDAMAEFLLIALAVCGKYVAPQRMAELIRDSEIEELKAMRAERAAEESAASNP